MSLSLVSSVTLLVATAMRNHIHQCLGMNHVVVGCLHLCIYNSREWVVFNAIQ
jgi:hypothetical protein